MTMAETKCRVIFCGLRDPLPPWHTIALPPTRNVGSKPLGYAFVQYMPGASLTLCMCLCAWWCVCEHLRYDPMRHWGYTTTKGKSIGIIGEGPAPRCLLCTFT